MMTGQSRDERCSAVNEAVFAIIADQIGKVHYSVSPKYTCEFTQMIDVYQKMIDAYQKHPHDIQVWEDYFEVCNIA
jgi:hypothetical protein